MKTTKITVNTHGDGMERALQESEKTGISCGLSPKELLRLRLLSEELFGMIRSITGNTQADYWLEYQNRHFSIHLQLSVRMTQDLYTELVDVSTSGKNVAVKGFMGNIKNMIAVMLLPQNVNLLGSSLGLMSLGGSASQYNGSEAYNWSMSRYKAGLEDDDTETDDKENASDELEKSIIASLSDEITVSIVGSRVEITIFKTF